MKKVSANIGGLPLTCRWDERVVTVDAVHVHDASRLPRLHQQVPRRREGEARGGAPAAAAPERRADEAPGDSDNGPEERPLAERSC